MTPFDREPRDLDVLRQLVLDSAPGPARPISNARAAALVQAALAAAVPAESVARRRWPRFALAAGVSLALAGAAVAAIRLGRVAPVHPLSAPVPGRAVDGPFAPAPAPAALPRPAAALEAPVADDGLAPVGTAPDLRRPRISTSSAGAPSDILRLANHQRELRRWRDAEVLYMRAARADPGGAVAGTAAVAAAALRLEHLGDPAGALRLFQRALRAGSSAALAESAEWGIADAYHALGRPSDEAAALRSFVAHYPASLMRARAEARLATLAARP